MLRNLLLVLLCWPLGVYAACQSERVEVQVLGSGGPELTDGRASSGYLVRLDGKGIVLVDAGSGSALGFERSGADFSDVEVMLLSHVHTDHSADVPSYAKGAFFTDRKGNLPVLGPEGDGAFPSTEAFVAAMIGPPSSAAYAYLNDFLDPAQESAFKIEPRSVPATGEAIWSDFRTDRLLISSVPVHHGPVPALAWRVDVAGCGIVFSGDMSGRYDTLPKLARGADLLVAHNAVPEDATGVARNLHMPPSVIGRLAAASEVGSLVLSHRMDRTLGKEEETTRLIREHYQGPLAFADDLDRFRPETTGDGAP